MARTVIAVFDSLYSASKAIAELEENGLNGDLINIYSRPERGGPAGKVKKVKKNERFNVSPEVEVDGQNSGARIGSGIGGAAGIAAGMMAAVGMIQAPFLTGIIGAGPLGWTAVWLGAIGVFAAAGSLTGLLLGGALGLGIPEREMRQYARIACSDDVILAVLADWNDIDAIIQLISKHAPLTLEEKALTHSIEEQIASKPPVKNVMTSAREREDHR